MAEIVRPVLTGPENVGAVSGTGGLSTWHQYVVHADIDPCCLNRTTPEGDGNHRVHIFHFSCCSPLQNTGTNLQPMGPSAGADAVS